jgi:hypothetical protein
MNTFFRYYPKIVIWSAIGMIIVPQSMGYFESRTKNAIFPDYLYASITSHGCEDAQGNQYEGRAKVSLETSTHFSAFSCDEMFLNFYQWQATFQFDKAYDMSSIECANSKHESHSVGDIVRQRISPKAVRLYQCQGSDAERVWVIYEQI